MTQSEYFAAVKHVLINKHHLTEAQAIDVVRRHSGEVSSAWEYGEPTENVGIMLKFREDDFKQYKGDDRDLLIAAVKCLSQRLASDGYDTPKILQSNGIDPDKIAKLIGGK
jgi:hypothetical protein